MTAPGHARQLAPDVRRGLASAVLAFGRRTRARGLRYAREGRVDAIVVGDASIEAVVQGSEAYRVLWQTHGRSSAWIGTCACPVGISCKHAYAVAAVLLRPEDLPPQSAEPVSRWAGLDAIGDDDAAIPPRPAVERAALARLRESTHSWERHAAAATLAERAGLGYGERHDVVAAAHVDDSDADVRCWHLARALARAVGAERVPPVLAPFLERADVEQRVLDRQRSRLRHELLEWAGRGRAAPRRSLRALLGMREGPQGRLTLAIDVRVTSPRGETSRTPSQLRQLRNDVRNDPALLPPEQAALLALLADVTTESAWIRHEITLPIGPLRLFLDHGARWSLVHWSEEINPGLARRGGITPGAPARLVDEPVQIAPACTTRAGDTVLDLSFVFAGGRRVALGDALLVRAGESWRGDASPLVVIDGALHAVVSAPPETLIDRFQATSGLRLAPEERVPVLSQLAGRWPHLRDTLAAHTHVVDVQPVVALDLREDDWLKLRVLARRTGAPEPVRADDVDPETSTDFAYAADGAWRPVARASAPDAATLPLDPAQASGTPRHAGTPPSVAPEDAWLEAPDPLRVAPAVGWLDATGAFPGDRRGPGGLEVPWPDRDTGFWLRLTSRRVADFFAAWEARPPDVVYLGNERARRLVAPPARTLPRVRVAASGVDFLAVSADWESEAAGLSPEDVAALRAATTRFVRLRSGWVRKPEATDGDAVEQALADLGIELGGGEQRLTLWQLAGARPESLDALGGAGADADTLRAVRDLRERIASFRGVPRVPLPRTLRAKLRPYQRDGLDFLAFATELGTGAILADDMGLGKTVQALAWLEHLRKRDPEGGPALVVCPASVVHNWRREAERFVPSLRVLVLERGGARHALRAEAARHDLVITNYALLRRDAAAWHETELRAAILDEAQNVKNPDAAVTRAASALRARYRLALTGTPLENRPLDLFSIASFVAPGFLGSRKQFAARFDRHDLPAASRVLLAARLRPILLRRLKRDVAQDLPDRIEERRDCELTPGQRRLYLAELAKSRDLVARLAGESDGIRRNKIAILAALTRLRQICCHPALAGGKPDLGSGKLEALLEVLEPLLAEGHKVLVFSQFVSLLRIVERELDARGVAHHVLTGETVDRESVLRRFADDPRASVFLLSLKAGGTGLNLTMASYVVLFDPWWNPAVEAQAIDRSHRIGQDRTVIAYRLIARGTIEEKIAHLQERKASLVRDLLGDGGAARGLTRADLEFLLAPEGA